MSTNSLSSQMPLSVCTCSERCTFAGVEYGRCKQHDIEMGETFGHHFCLKCEMFHCKSHYKRCCDKYGKSIMIRTSETIPVIRRRAKEFINDWEEEVRECEAYVNSVKTRPFICAECRNKICTCDLKNFLRYERRKKKRAQLLDKLMRARDEDVRRFAGI